MKISNTTKKLLHFDQIIFVGLLFTVTTLIAIISIRYPIQFDWSYNNRNTLHPSSQSILKQMPEDIFVTVFIGGDGDSIETRNSIRILINRYQRYKKNIQLSFINPKKNPAQTRALGIHNNNEVILSYKDKEERLQTLSEEIFSNALQRLMRNEKHYLVFLSGHGERRVDDKANHNFGLFGQRLRDKGFKLQSLNLSEISSIPDSTKLFVIANPQENLLDGEINIIRKYLNRGGNLLWLTEPYSKNSLSDVLPTLKIERLPGTIADYAAQISVGQLDYTLATAYPPHPITQNLGSISLFPQASGLSFPPDNTEKYTYRDILRSSKNSWTETDRAIWNTKNSTQFDENSEEKSGPIVFGVSATRSINDTEQRIVVIGDADFIANSHLGNAGNLELGLNIFNWLSFDDHFISIKPLTSPDTQLQLSNSVIVFIALTFFIVIPVGLLSTGLTIWWKRRKK